MDLLLTSLTSFSAETAGGQSFKMKKGKIQKAFKAQNRKQKICRVLLSISIILAFLAISIAYYGYGPEKFGVVRATYFAVVTVRTYMQDLAIYETTA